MIAALLDRLRQGDRNALARLISHAARGEHLAEMMAGFLARSSGIGVADEGNWPRAARVIAFTGSGGVGKSTLIGKLIPIVREEGRKVAVLACDPQSPLSGGALLGDRFRIGSPVDDGIFIRSLAAVSGHAAVADHLEMIIRLLEAFGFDVILLETAGSGQGDVEVRNLADIVVLLLQPESGDDVQWEKAGILECANVIVIHKADLPGAEQTADQVCAALELSPQKSVSVLRVSTKANAGHVELWRAIQAMPLRHRQASAARLLYQLTDDWLRERFRAAQDRHDATLVKLVNAWEHGDLAARDAAQALLSFLATMK